MNKRTMILASLAITLAGALCVLAEDRGPQQYAATLPDGTGSITPIAADGWGRVTPRYLVFQAAATETQTVSVVSGTITNTVGTKVIASGDSVMTISNTPPLFAGDSLLIVSSATGVTNSATLIGDLWE